MKKYLKILLLTFVIFLLGILNVYAVETSVSLVPNVTEVKAEDTFKIVISMKCEEDFEGLTGVLEYDKTKLKLVDADSGEGFKDLNSENNDGEYVISILNNVNASENTTVTEGDCQTLEFKVLAGVEEGETLKIALKNINFKAGENKETLENQIATVKVATNSEETDKEEADKPTEEGKKDETDKETTQGEKDQTQADKNHEKAGLKDYTLVIIAGMIALVIISYAKYKQYKNI